MEHLELRIFLHEQLHDLEIAVSPRELDELSFRIGDLLLDEKNESYEEGFERGGDAGYEDGFDDGRGESELKIRNLEKEIERINSKNG